MQIQEMSRNLKLLSHPEYPEETSLYLVAYGVAFAYLELAQNVIVWILDYNDGLISWPKSSPLPYLIIIKHYLLAPYEKNYAMINYINLFQLIILLLSVFLF